LIFQGQAAKNLLSLVFIIHFSLLRSELMIE
jgi:hypothetical protein